MVPPFLDVLVVSLALFSTSSKIFSFADFGIGIKDLFKSSFNFFLIESISFCVGISFFFFFMESFFAISTISALLSFAKASYLSIDFDNPIIKKKIIETVK
ncbi:hypothetical protein [Polaribacter porphyrae]|uniref:Uncharacterized protein n=1 Tax=Polaribacter porphyrae TaxID=1137780 RepID=A0A2S7WP26_9FLAO|nr:hypothetical protein [Polaribacter porphyrae]PQJ79365.1 hypothetical protein BTO18_09350 [Polaribacter porphyrae]